ncbi:MAG: transporter substrate-binding domain-containing protein [Saccharospirillaceae bacterium]|nr:transporter substrate-binding domain-containing protein [Pseudomonadales bacterium]NRB79425.1 transporter substrate-binding domain-containing protein [Saccharospirillaceae bacterium]
MKALIFFIILYIPLISFSSQVQLTVALGETDYPPFYFVQDGKYYGSSLEIAEAVAKRLDIELVYERYPWSRVLKNLETGTVDMVIHFFNTPERASSVIHTGVPHIFESSYLFVRENSDIVFDGDLKKLQQYDISNISGYSHGKDYDNANYLNKMPVSAEDNLVNMLIRNRFDIAVGNKPTILMSAKKDGIDDKIKFLTPIIDEGPCYMAFSRIKPNSKALAAMFTEEIIEFKKTDEYKNILKKYNFDFPVFNPL